MKYSSSVFLTLIAFATLSGAAVDPTDRKALADHLKQSSSEFLESVKGLTPEQWNYKPSPETWSIAECAEHIALSEDFIRGMVERQVLTSPARETQTTDRRAVDDRVQKMITDRSFKAKAPEPLKPTRQFATPDAAVKAFVESRRRTLELAANRPDLREHFGPHPVLKELDGYQWILYLSGHTMRHTAQIREVKATSGFPTN